MIYKGYEIKVTDFQGNGSFASPLCNTPFGYEILKHSKIVYVYGKMSSSFAYAIESAKRVIDLRSD